MSRRHTPLALLILFILTPLVGAQEKFYRPELSTPFLDRSMHTDWYGVYLQNKKIGYVRNERKRQGDTIVEHQLMSLKLVSSDMKIEIEQMQSLSFQGKAPYRLIGARLVEKGGPITKVTTFAWNPAKGGYDAIHEVGGEKRQELLKDIDFTLSDHAATEVWVQQDPKVGDVVVTREFDPSEQKMDVQTNKVLSAKHSLASGVKVHFYEVATKSRLREFETVSRYDDQGNTLSATVAIFELRKETEQQAKNTQYSQDLFVMGMAKIDKGIGRSDKVRDLVLEVDGADGIAFEDGPRQSAVTGPSGKVRLRLGKKHGKEVKATPEEIKEALTETNVYPITHPKIKELAEKATAGATTDAEKVAKIVRFVHNYITPRLSANAPYIHDLIEKREGDCKSYALLVTSLARASGVPARELSGLVYISDDAKAFAGHAWNEVVIGGVWVPVDAVVGQTDLDATHISFGTEHRATKSMLNSLGKLSFRLVEANGAK